MSDEIERKILSMFGLEMSHLDIAGHISEIHGLDIPNASVSAIHYKVKQGGAMRPRRFTRFRSCICRKQRAQISGYRC